MISFNIYKNISYLVSYLLIFHNFFKGTIEWLGVYNITVNETTVWHETAVGLHVSSNAVFIVGLKICLMLFYTFVHVSFGEIDHLSVWRSLELIPTVDGNFDGSKIKPNLTLRQKLVFLKAKIYSSVNVLAFPMFVYSILETIVNLLGLFTDDRKWSSMEILYWWMEYLILNAYFLGLSFVTLSKIGT